MTKELTYQQVIELLTTSESDEFIQQVIVLLTFVHETINTKSLQKSDFIFTQYKEGHILVSCIKEEVPPFSE